MVNNSSNNIDVYKTVNSFKKQKLFAQIDIQGKCMISSVCKAKKFVIGCKEGSVIEIDLDTLEKTKVYQASTVVSAIEYLDTFLEDTFVIS